LLPLNVKKCLMIVTLARNGANFGQRLSASPEG
jgi:hypothetical protein